MKKIFIFTAVISLFIPNISFASSDEEISILDRIPHTQGSFIYDDEGKYAGHVSEDSWKSVEIVPIEEYLSPNDQVYLLGDGIRTGQRIMADYNNVQATVGLVLDMYKSVLPGIVFPRTEVFTHLISDESDAYFDPNKHQLVFYVNADTGEYTCRSLSTVSHEPGHLVFYNLLSRKFGRNFKMSQQATAFDESFGDLTFAFLTFWHPLLRERSLAHLGVDLEGTNCLATFTKRCLTNHVNLIHIQGDPTLCEEHSLSEWFTGAVYEALVESYKEQKKAKINPVIKAVRKGEIIFPPHTTEETYTFNKASKILGKTNSYFMNALIGAVNSLESPDFSFADISRLMLSHLIDQPSIKEHLAASFLQRRIFGMIYKQITANDELILIAASSSSICEPYELDEEEQDGEEESEEESEDERSGFVKRRIRR